MNGYNFTERVRKILQMAREEAQRLRHEYVGTEHILLGLLREGEGIASSVLENLGADADVLRAQMASFMKTGTVVPPGPDLPYTSRAKKVLELAMSSAREMSHSYVGSEHLLLGLIAEGKGIAAQVLQLSNVTLDRAQAETLRVLGTASGKEAVPSPSERSSRRWPPQPPRSVIVLLEYGGGLVAHRFGSPEEAVRFLREIEPEERG